MFGVFHASNHPFYFLFLFSSSLQNEKSNWQKCQNAARVRANAREIKNVKQVEIKKMKKKKISSQSFISQCSFQANGKNRK